MIMKNTLTEKFAVKLLTFYYKTSLHTSYDKNKKKKYEKNI